MQAALDHLRKDLFETRLSPLLYGHINVLGQYSFRLNDQVMKGLLRPLNQEGLWLESL